MRTIELTIQNFDTEALQENNTILIDFWATWCTPCRMLSPIVDEIAVEAPRGVKVCKVNIDEQPELAQQFNVKSIPTLVVLKEGKRVASSVGAQPKKAILKMIENV